MNGIDYNPPRIEQTTWQQSEPLLSGIRQKVFVEEQQVPIEEELDQHDATAKHWLAYSTENQAIATARMIQKNDIGQVGRMAVLAEHRGKGIGAALLRQIIRYASSTDIQQLSLNAQLSAQGFYRTFGFMARGETFLDAGIEHIAMTLDLYRYRKQTAGHSPNSDQLVSIDSAEQFANRLQQLAFTAHTTIRVYSSLLPVNIYSNPELCEAFYTFAVSKPQAEIKVLIDNLSTIQKTTVGLIELAQRLPSRFQLRKTDEDSVINDHDYAIQDKQGIVYCRDPDTFTGYYRERAPQRAQQLISSFEILWRDSHHDPELRRLSL